MTATSFMLVIYMRWTFNALSNHKLFIKACKSAAAFKKSKITLQDHRPVPMMVPHDGKVGPFGTGSWVDRNYVTKWETAKLCR